MDVPPGDDCPTVLVTPVPDEARVDGLRRVVFAVANPGRTPLNVPDDPACPPQIFTYRVRGRDQGPPPSKDPGGGSGGRP